MKTIKAFTTITALLLFINTAVAQMDYDRGFKVGYKEGYCYNDFGCISPIAPITPIPYIGENNNSYQDGYNRGFKMGMEDKQRDKTKSSGYSGYNSGGGGTYKSQYQSQYVAPDYDLIIKALEMKQARYEKEKQMMKDKAIAQMKSTRSYYSSFSNYPEKIKDGWHTAVIMNNYDFCDERKVYVKDNKVTSYCIDNWNVRTVTFTGPINSGKTIIKIIGTDNNETDFMDVYFIENIIEPNKHTSAPIKPGKISFWTNWKKAGTVKLYFEGAYVGQFNKYFPEGTPNCGQDGTMTITYKPGTYSYKAVGQTTWGDITWNGKITITANGCQTMLLKRK